MPDKLLSAEELEKIIHSIIRSKWSMAQIDDLRNHIAALQAEKDEAEGRDTKRYEDSMIAHRFIQSEVLNGALNGRDFVVTIPEARKKWKSLQSRVTELEAENSATESMACASEERVAIAALEADRERLRAAQIVVEREMALEPNVVRVECEIRPLRLDVHVFVKQLDWEHSEPVYDRELKIRDELGDAANVNFRVVPFDAVQGKENAI
jgi:hypothetical protein